MHVHGVTWLDTKKLEQVVEVDGKLTVSKSQVGTKPMAGLTAAFKKLRYNEKLNESNIKSLVNFIDSFITVCTHGNTVGQKVATIAREVNEHQHTKTCRKHGDGECRFHYPRLPAPHTIIMEPNKESSLPWENCQLILNKVMDVVTNDEIIENI